jgi:hypothetical protein
VARAWRQATSLLCCACAAALRAYAGPQLELGTTSGASGTTAVLPLTFQSSSNVVAAQFDLRYSLPTVTGQAPALLQSVPDLTIASAQIAAGVQRLLIYSRSGSPWPDSLQLNIPCAIATNAAPGSAAVTLANALFSDSQARSISADRLGAGAISIVGAVGPHFQSVQLAPDGTLELQFTGQPGRRYVLQTSPDLRVWLPIRTNAAPAGIVVVTDRPTGRQLFYRAAQVP